MCVSEVVRGRSEDSHLTFSSCFQFEGFRVTTSLPVAKGLPADTDTEQRIKAKMLRSMLELLAVLRVTVPRVTCQSLS